MYFLAFFSGFLNGALGTGGGVLCLIFLFKIFPESKKAFAAVSFFLLPITVISLSASDVIKNEFLIPVCIGGGLGGFLGNRALSKIKSDVLTKIFALFIIALGVKTLL